MRYILENDRLIVEIDSFGAELKSVRSKVDNREYMWYADKKYWGRTSPVLFPFVGSLRDKSYVAKGKNYPMGQHGFARDMEHVLVEKSEDSILFQLLSSDETMEKYPYSFALRIGYQLSDNEVKVIWEVDNTDEEILPFSIGAHPAFICPASGLDNKDGYKLSFGKFAKEQGNNDQDIRIDSKAVVTKLSEIHHHGNTRDTGLAITEDILISLNDGACDITPDFFDRCTYMIEGNQANSVGIVDSNNHEYVTVLFDTPLFAIWSPEEKNAPFICIEPWYGRCDHVDFEGTIEDREYTNKLEENKTFHAEYVMRFN